MPVKQDPYQLKPCPVCGKDIPPYTKAGRLLAPSKYAEKRTCSDICTALRQGKLRAERKIPAPLEAIDGFVAGNTFGGAQITDVWTDEAEDLAEICRESGKDFNLEKYNARPGRNQY